MSYLPLLRSNVFVIAVVLFIDNNDPLPFYPLDLPVALPVQFQLDLVVPAERGVVRHADHSDALVPYEVVDNVLQLRVQGAGGLVKHSVLGPVVQEAQHSYALLLAHREHSLPVYGLVLPHPVIVQEVLKADLCQHLSEALWWELCLVVPQRVGDLLGEQAVACHVRTLREVLHLCEGLDDLPRVERPQPVQDPQQRAFPAATRPRHHNVSPFMHLEA